MKKVNYKTYINILVFLKFLAPVIAVFYLIGWILQAVNVNLFNFVNFFLGFIPKIFNSILNVQTLLFGKIVPMGYAYSACLFTGFFYLVNIFIKKLEQLNKIQENEELKIKLEKQKEYKKKRLAQIAAEKKLRKAKSEPEPPMIDLTDKKKFFGLFEFVLEYPEDYEQNLPDLNKLKVEFSKIMVKKLMEKYPDISFGVDNRIFFICNNFSKFGIFTKDVLMLFRTFLQTGMMQSIKTGMLFSYWVDEDVNKKNEIFMILNKLNELRYLNKIIVSREVYLRFSREDDSKHFSFEPMGAAKLMGVFENKDVDVDLYSITKVE